MPASATPLKPLIVPVIKPPLIVQAINVPYTTKTPNNDDRDLLTMLESSRYLVFTANRNYSHINNTVEIVTRALAIRPDVYKVHIANSG